MSKLLNEVIGGFALNGTATYESGLPFTPTYQECTQDQDIDGFGGSLCRPSHSGQSYAFGDQRLRSGGPHPALLCPGRSLSCPWAHKRRVHAAECRKQRRAERNGKGERGGWREGKRDHRPSVSHLHNGYFADVTHAAGLDGLAGWGQGACVGDYDNDGYDDLYITFYGSNRLLHNERNGTFKEVGGPAGVAGSGRAWGTGCTFVDYDRDGKLDLLVANYVDFDVSTTPKPGEGVMCIWKGTPVMCGPRGLPSTPNVLYRNLGNGRFQDVSAKSGIEKTDGHYCFSAASLDFNNDGWPDIYVACDSTPSILYRNNKDGTFTDVAAEAGVAFDEDGREQAGMGVTIGDYDGDGRPDLFKTNFSDDTSSLYHNDGGGAFTSQIAQSGLGLNTKYLGWETMFFDPENRGVLDLVLANGHVYPEVDTAHLGSTYKEPRLLYRNEGKGHFADLSAKAGPGMTVPASSRGLAIADLWNDGRTEVIVNNMSGQPMVLVNTQPNTNHWIAVQTVGTRSNRDGIGAVVTLRTRDRSYTQEVRSGGSYLSSSDLRLHFRLGGETVVVAITAVWPSGLREAFPAPAVDRLVEVHEGSGIRLDASR